MKGFIVALRKAKNEDMVITLLSKEYLKTMYRFYGARHSILQLGYLIDYEDEENSRGFMPRLRRVSHIGFPWLHDRDRLMLWHTYIQLFEPHLRDTETLESFYFDALLEAAKKWNRQNPKRIICENYHSIQKFEGRLHPLDKCYICEKPLGNDVSLMTAMIPAHPECIYASSMPRKKLASFFETGSTVSLEDRDVEYLYNVCIKGL